MAFYQIKCAQCKHAFYRVEVRCGEYPEHYACPMCNSEQTKKKFVPPRPDQISAEKKECCRGTHFQKSGCGKCGKCG